jgi:hypothetical protein
MWEIIGIAVVVMAMSVSWWMVGRWLSESARRGEPSPVAIELAAMQATWRVRDAERAAEQHMDDFIAEREAEQRRTDPTVIDGDVLEVHDDPWGPGWSR